MTKPIIKVQNLSKQYSIGAREATYATLRESLVGAMRAPLKRLRRNGRSQDNTIWALKDVSFEVRPGEVIGIIGRNGAGKSTLLKILSRITEPTAGRVELYGRVGSLLEVGTGFHPELTGRENIYLNGAILGMKRREIERNFDEIVAFAEVEKFIDTPVKHYSSGMYLRLAFAVAAHLDPEILLVDEVLAVGDAAFQKKCLGKMSEVANQGRTVLFVSHNMGAIRNLCSRCIWLAEGLQYKQGAALQMVGEYIAEGLDTEAERNWRLDQAPGDDTLRLKAVRICQPHQVSSASIDISQPFEIEIESELLANLPEVAISLKISTGDGEVVLHTADVLQGQKTTRNVGRWISTCKLPAYTLNTGLYVLSVGADIPNLRVVFTEESVLSWSVQPLCPMMARYSPESWKGILGPGIATWQVYPVSNSASDK